MCTILQHLLFLSDLFREHCRGELYSEWAWPLFKPAQNFHHQWRSLRPPQNPQEWRTKCTWPGTTPLDYSCAAWASIWKREPAGSSPCCTACGFCYYYSRRFAASCSSYIISTDYRGRASLQHVVKEYRSFIMMWVSCNKATAHCQGCWFKFCKLTWSEWNCPLQLYHLVKPLSSYACNQVEVVISSPPHTHTHTHSHTHSLTHTHTHTQTHIHTRQ